MTTSVHQFLCLTDNYGVLVHDSKTGATASIDAPEAGPIFAALDAKGWKLTDLLITHHHADHIQGAPELKARFPSSRSSARPRKSRASRPRHAGREGDYVRVGSLEAKVFETPGHTTGHVAYYFGEDEIVFCGDTLFSLGCGRAFEAPYAVLWSSLLKLAALPGDTQVYCGHEYTEANARFALTIEPRQSEPQGPRRARGEAPRRETPDPADDDRPRARRQSVPAGRGAFGAGGGRPGRRRRGRGVRRNPRAQGPVQGMSVARLGLLARVRPRGPGPA